uniref:PDZ domain-containing protein n=1 Tax=Coccolithus braarudii TaxID=221442 RepID=A0A7S0L521_9EUKA
MFTRRPDVIKVGTLTKEGGTRLSATFPSQRVCVLLTRKLEYYQPLTIKLHHGNEQTKLGIDLNDWNLVVHVKPGYPASAEGGLSVGDVLVGVNGDEIGDGLATELLSGSSSTSVNGVCKLRVLRPKGEVPLTSAGSRRLLRRHGGWAFAVLPNPRDVAQPRRSTFVFVAETESDAEEWITQVEAAIRSCTLLDRGRGGAGPVSLPSTADVWATLIHQ